MTREQIKKWLPEITHFANGGNLWWYSYRSNIWHKQMFLYMEFAKTQNIIEDNHFKARKANALGESIEAKYSNCAWVDSLNPDFKSFDYYRPKKKEWYENIPKEGILCWAWDNINEKQVEVIKWKRPQGFMTIHSLEWKYAEPIKPEECWKETK